MNASIFTLDEIQKKRLIRYAEALHRDPMVLFHSLVEDYLEDLEDGIMATEIMQRVKAGEEKLLTWEEVKSSLDELPDEESSQTLATFLQTDLYRIETALEDRAWTEAVSTRINDHLNRLSQILTLVTAAPIANLPTRNTLEDALDTLHTLTDELLTAIAALPSHRLDALVLDPHERHLTLLAHLYDYARLSAMLVEWSRHLAPPPTLDEWFQEPEE